MLMAFSLTTRTHLNSMYMRLVCLSLVLGVKLLRFDYVSTVDNNFVAVNKF
jgi:hypothetical protein